LTRGCGGGGGGGGGDVIFTRADGARLEWPPSPSKLARLRETMCY
jgi:hypothetical protein